MKTINLNEWTKAGEGFEADSFNNNKDENIMLKLYQPFILTKRIEESFTASNEYIKLGINTPKAYEMVECDGRIGVIYERIKNKTSLYRMLVNDHEKVEEVATLFGNVLRDFHKNIVDTNKGRSRIEVLEENACGMFNKADWIDDDKKSELINKTKVFFAQFGDEAKEPNICMGDCHIGNVILANDKLYFIDISALVYGTPLIDLGWFIPTFSDNKIIDNALPEKERIPLEYKKRFGEKFRETYFAGKDNKYIEEQYKKINVYANIQNLFLNIYLTKNISEISKILDTRLEK